MNEERKNTKQNPIASSTEVSASGKLWPHAEDIAGPVTLSVAGYPTTVALTSPQLQAVYLPLLRELDELQQTSGGRLLVGLAGIPGGGKSTFAATLSHVARRLWGPERFLAVGMDGWHLSNTVLDQRIMRDEQGRDVPLRKRKGSPDSFDALAMAAQLRRLRDATTEVRLPAYDRRLHEPVVDALVVSPRTNILLLEGNYLFSPTPPWDQVAALLKLKLFIECDPAVAREQIIARHQRGGMSEVAAREKYQFNDRPNIETVFATAGQADILIRLEPRPELIVTR